MRRRVYGMRWRVALAVGVFANICSAGLQEGVVAYQRGDFSAALHELRPLAENGDATAQAFLGLMYEYGHAVKMDDVQAAKWIQKAADGGNAMAQGNLSSDKRDKRDPGNKN